MFKPHRHSYSTQRPQTIPKRTIFSKLLFSTYTGPLAASPRALAVKKRYHTDQPRPIQKRLRTSQNCLKNGSGIHKHRMVRSKIANNYLPPGNLAILAPYNYAGDVLSELNYDPYEDDDIPDTLTVGELVGVIIKSKIPNFLKKSKKGQHLGQDGPGIAKITSDTHMKQQLRQVYRHKYGIPRLLRAAMMNNHTQLSGTDAKVRINTSNGLGLSEPPKMASRVNIDSFLVLQQEQLYLQFLTNNLMDDILHKIGHNSIKKSVNDQELDRKKYDILHSNNSQYILTNKLIGGNIGALLNKYVYDAELAEQQPKTPENEKISNNQHNPKFNLSSEGIDKVQELLSYNSWVAAKFSPIFIETLHKLMLLCGIIASSPLALTATRHAQMRSHILQSMLNYKVFVPRVGDDITSPTFLQKKAENQQKIAKMYNNIDPLREIARIMQLYDIIEDMDEFFDRYDLNYDLLTDENTANIDENQQNSGEITLHPKLYDQTYKKVRLLDMILLLIQKTGHYDISYYDLSRFENIAHKINEIPESSESINDDVDEIIKKRNDIVDHIQASLDHPYFPPSKEQLSIHYNNNPQAFWTIGTQTAENDKNNEKKDQILVKHSFLPLFQQIHGDNRRNYIITHNNTMKLVENEKKYSDFLISQCGSAAFSLFYNIYSENISKFIYLEENAYKRANLSADAAKAMISAPKKVVDTRQLARYYKNGKKSFHNTEQTDILLESLAFESQKYHTFIKQFRERYMQFWGDLFPNVREELTFDKKRKKLQVASFFLKSDGENETIRRENAFWGVFDHKSNDYTLLNEYFYNKLLNIIEKKYIFSNAEEFQSYFFETTLVEYQCMINFMVDDGCAVKFPYDESSLKNEKNRKKMTIKIGPSLIEQRKLDQKRDLLPLYDPSIPHQPDMSELTQHYSAVKKLLLSVHLNARQDVIASLPPHLYTQYIEIMEQFAPFINPAIHDDKLKHVGNQFLDDMFSITPQYLHSPHKQVLYTDEENINFSVLVRNAKELLSNLSNYDLKLLKVILFESRKQHSLLARYLSTPVQNPITSDNILHYGTQLYDLDGAVSTLSRKIANNLNLTELTHFTAENPRKIIPAQFRELCRVRPIGGRGFDHGDDKVSENIEEIREYSPESTEFKGNTQSPQEVVSEDDHKINQIYSTKTGQIDPKIDFDALKIPHKINNYDENDAFIPNCDEYGAPVENELVNMSIIDSNKKKNDNNNKENIINNGDMTENNELKPEMVTNSLMDDQQNTFKNDEKIDNQTVPQNDDKNIENTDDIIEKLAKSGDLGDIPIQIFYDDQFVSKHFKMLYKLGNVEAMRVYLSRVAEINYDRLTQEDFDMLLTTEDKMHEYVFGESIENDYDETTSSTINKEHHENELFAQEDLLIQIQTFITHMQDEFDPNSHQIGTHSEKNEEFSKATNILIKKYNFENKDNIAEFIANLARCEEDDARINMINTVVEQAEEKYYQDRVNEYQKRMETQLNVKLNQNTEFSQYDPSQYDEQAQQMGDTQSKSQNISNIGQSTENYSKNTENTENKQDIPHQHSTDRLDLYQKELEKLKKAEKMGDNDNDENGIISSLSIADQVKFEKIMVKMGNILATHQTVRPANDQNYPHDDPMQLTEEDMVFLRTIFPKGSSPALDQAINDIDPLNDLGYIGPSVSEIKAKWSKMSEMCEDGRNEPERYANSGSRHEGIPNPEENFLNIAELDKMALEIETIAGLNKQNSAHNGENESSSDHNDENESSSDHNDENESGNDHNDENESDSDIDDETYRKYEEERQKVYSNQKSDEKDEKTSTEQDGFDEKTSENENNDDFLPPHLQEFLSSQEAHPLPKTPQQQQTQSVKHYEKSSETGGKQADLSDIEFDFDSLEREMTTPPPKRPRNGQNNMPKSMDNRDQNPSNTNKSRQEDYAPRLFDAEVVDESAETPQNIPPIHKNGDQSSDNDSTLLSPSFFNQRPHSPQPIRHRTRLSGRNLRARADIEKNDV